ncbi:MAG: hypothetical protein RDV48_01335 [Candidatus Eremiobacteraeota bacterium]|nr:hypothetical protein [Candidatus Eremiobacteraeota bacterium]
MDHLEGGESGGFEEEEEGGAFYSEDFFAEVQEQEAVFDEEPPAESHGGAVDFMLEWQEQDEGSDDHFQDSREARAMLSVTGQDEGSDDHFHGSREAHAMLSITEQEEEAPPVWERVSEEEAPSSPRIAFAPPLRKEPAPESPSVQTLPQNTALSPGGAAPAETAPPPVSHEAPPPPGASAHESQPGAPPQPHGAVQTTFTAVPAGESEAKGEAPEYFQWTAERNRLIEEALREMTGAKLPRVHEQLISIRRALQEKKLTGEQASALLDEVELYLASRVSREREKIPVAHEAVIGARHDVENGMAAYRETVNALREYIATGDRLHLDLASYTADQAASFVARARTLLAAAEPERPQEK